MLVNFLQYLWKCRVKCVIILQEFKEILWNNERKKLVIDDHKVIGKKFITHYYLMNTCVVFQAVNFQVGDFNFLSVLLVCICMVEGY